MKKYVKYLLVALWMVTLLGANDKTINYKATFGIFGKVGHIANHIHTNGNHYQIDTTVTLAGMAKMIMGGQVEHYTSKGHIENGLMVTDSYEMVSTKGSKRTIKAYRIDHQKRRVIKEYTKIKNGKVVKHYRKDLHFYAKDDLLTLYFNMDKHIKNHADAHRFTLKAVGLEKQKGLVEITVAKGKEIQAYKKDLGRSANWYAKAQIVQKNFRKKKGDILLSVDSDGYIKNAVIKDILMYGDAKLTRTK